MYGIAKTIEHLAARLNSTVLIAVGIVIILLGMFIWLGGFGYRKLVFTLAGAACGAIASCFLPGFNLLLTVAMLGVGAYLAVQFEERFTASLAAIIMAAMGFTILVRPYVNFSRDLPDTARQFAIAVPPLNWIMLIGLIIVPFVAAVLYWRFTAAFSCSAVGTILLFIGGSMLYLQKGQSAVSYIYNRPSLFLYIFAALAVFGTVEQLLFARTVRFIKGTSAVRTLARKKKPKTDKEIVEKTVSWRSA